jgi:predicted dehydrogenase
VAAVTLAVPTQLHSSIGKELLEQGIHVLVEKPIAEDLAGADELIQAQSKGESVLHVGHSERFNPVVEAVRGYVSTPQFFEAHRLGVFVSRSLDIDVVLDLMIHDLDLILHLSAGELVEIRAVGIPVLTPRVDIANARLEFDNGCVANVTASRVSKEKIRKLRFFQPHDYISLDFHNQLVEMYSLSGNEREKQIIERSLDIRQGEPLRVELEAFLAAIAGDSSSVACTGEEGKRALAVALDILRKIQ